jgi:RHS repeat-associated protein
MVDATTAANITHKYQYDDFGNLTQQQETDVNPFRYVGKYGVMYENDHLVYMRARYYDPTIGRFMSEDPVWSTNLYPYADNNAIKGIDPMGRYTPNDYMELGKTIYGFFKNANDVNGTISDLGEGNTQEIEKSAATTIATDGIAEPVCGSVAITAATLSVPIIGPFAPIVGIVTFVGCDLALSYVANKLYDATNTESNTELKNNSPTDGTKKSKNPPSKGMKVKAKKPKQLKH